MQRFFALSIFLLSLSGCKKDPPISEPCVDCSDCVPLPSSPSGFGWQHTYDSLQFMYPCFNPADLNEFLFLVLEQFPFETLYRHNIVTKTTDTILTGIDASAYGVPQWGPNGWIVMALSDYKIWKVKANGDSLTQLTFNGQCFMPKWTYTGSIAFYCHEGPNVYPTYIMDINGQFLDTITTCKLTGWVDWNHSDYAVREHCGIELFNTENKTCETILNSDCGEFIAFCGASTVVWPAFTGILTTNIFTLETKRIVESCSSRTYSFPSYSYQSNKILWQRDMPIADIENNMLHHRNKIVIMNADGTDEQEIEIQL